MGTSPREVVEQLLADPLIEAWLRELALAFESMVAKADEVSPDIWLSAPRTTLRQLKHEFKLDRELSLPELGDAQMTLLGQLCGALLKSSDTVRAIAEAFRSSASSILTSTDDPAALKLLELAEQADLKIPYVARFAFLRKKKKDDTAIVRPIECAGRLEKARQSEGEERVREVMDAFKILAETIYPRYLVTLLRLAKLRERTWTKLEVTDSTGNILGAYTDDLRVEFASLVEIDAAFFRNAAGHENWEYLDGGRVKVWNQDPKDREVVKRGPEMFDADILLARAGDMFRHAHQAVDVAENVYKFRMIADLLEKALPLWEDLFTGSEQATAWDATIGEFKKLLEASYCFAAKHAIDQG